MQPNGFSGFYWLLSELLGTADVVEQLRYCTAVQSISVFYYARQREVIIRLANLQEEKWAKEKVEMYNDKFEKNLILNGCCNQLKQTESLVIV